MADFMALAKRFEEAPIWADDDDEEGFLAVDISPTEREMIVAALKGADALRALKLPA